MKAYTREVIQYKFCVELLTTVEIPHAINEWLSPADLEPFEISHTVYLRRGNNSYVVAFELKEDALYFIAWMELLEADSLEADL